MRNSFFVAALAAVAFCALSFTACGSMPTTDANVDNANEGEFGKNVLIPAMEFESRGLVFTETQFTITSRGAIEGSVFTYQQLLKQAQLLGADAIINVVIDKRIDRQSRGYDTDTVETWYGSALAIKYTRVLKTVTTRGGEVVQEEVYLNGNRVSGASPSGSASAEEAQRRRFLGIF